MGPGKAYKCSACFGFYCRFELWKYYRDFRRGKDLKDLDNSIEGMDVLIVEDIIDSWLTLCYLKDNLKSRGTNSIKICALLDKPYRRKADVKVDYKGFEIEDEFVVGYGLDFAERFRNLPDICVLKPGEYKGR